MTLLEDYEKSEETIRKLYDSKLRLSILDALKEGPMRLADLRRAVNANAPNTSAKAKELEEMGLLERVDGDFDLTSWGRTVLIQIKNNLQLVSTYEKYKEFWETHHMEGIPQEFLSRLGELHDSDLVKCSKENPIKTHEVLVEYLGTVKKELYVMSPILQNEWVTGLAHLLDNGVRMGFIFTKPMVAQFAKAAETLGKLGDFNDKAEFYIYPEEVSLPAFLASDTFGCLSIEAKAVPGNYMDMKLYSKNPEAIKWDIDMYNYFKSKYPKVKIKDYL